MGNRNLEENRRERRKEITVVGDRERVWAKEQLGSDPGFYSLSAPVSGSTGSNCVFKRRGI